MSIPLDRLYPHIDNISKQIADNIIIYHFYPHGSKKLTDLITLQKYLENNKTKRNWVWEQTVANLICHDQEPLNFNLYTREEFLNFVRYFRGYSNPDQHNCEYIIQKVADTHLRVATLAPLGCYDYTLLLHSEKNSVELKKYQDKNFIGVYYWSHAILALDWFRYAEHVAQSKQVEKTFLIYNRAWSGTREYRLKFTELLIQSKLNNNCRMNIDPIEPELNIHYDKHVFDNPAWKPNTVLENFFPVSSIPSSYSADFDLNDYEATDIEIVLETLFDDTRLHLTEKSLRPIACGQPFILASTPGSLKYLHSYGFKTFGHIWDEQYDSIEDPQERLIAITDLMKQIVSWDPSVYKTKMIQAKEIVDYNKKLFFSVAWHDSIWAELKTNLIDGMTKMNQNRSGKYFYDLREVAKKDPSVAEVINGDLPWRTQADVETVIQWIKNAE